MSNVQKIVHKSREVEYRFTFTPDGELEWSFISEGDGEIFNTTTTNVDSFTIKGGAPDLPIKVLDNEIVEIQIVPTDTEANSTLSVFTRREEDKQINFSVPNIQSGDGRYMYVLLKSGKVQKIDCSLLTADHWDDVNEVYTSTYIVDERTLPLPSEFNTSQYNTLMSFNHILFDPTSEKHIVVGFMGNDRIFCIFAGWLDSDLSVKSFGGVVDDYSVVGTNTNNGTYTDANKFSAPKNNFVHYIDNELWVTASISQTYTFSLVDGSVVIKSASIYLSQLSGEKTIYPINGDIWGTASFLGTNNSIGKYFKISIQYQTVYDFKNAVAIYAGSDNGGYHVIRPDATNTRGQTGIFAGAKRLSILRQGANQTLALVAATQSGYTKSIFLKNISTSPTYGFYVVSEIGSNYTSMPSFGNSLSVVCSDYTGLVMVELSNSNTIAILDGTAAQDLIVSGFNHGIADVGYITMESEIQHISCNKIL